MKPNRRTILKAVAATAIMPVLPVAAAPTLPPPMIRPVLDRAVCAIGPNQTFKTFDHFWRHMGSPKIVRNCMIYRETPSLSGLVLSEGGDEGPIQTFANTICFDGSDEAKEEGPRALGARVAQQRALYYDPTFHKSPDELREGHPLRQPAYFLESLIDLDLLPVSHANTFVSTFTTHTTWTTSGRPWNKSSILGHVYAT